MTPQDLVEIEQIKRLKYRYLRCLDQKLWDEIAECFTPDAIAAYSGGGYTFEGRDAIVDFLRRSMGAETFHSSHKMHHPEIDLTGPDSAHGVWALDDVVVMTDFELTVRGCSFYDDEYEKRDGAWRIVERRQVTDMVRTLSMDDEIALGETIARRDRTDPSYELLGE